MKKLGIYIHIPFCKRKCNYCDFYSINWNEESENKYIESVITEITSYESVLNNEYIVDTIFFGGGTPTIIMPQNIKKTIEKLNEFIKIDINTEISIEANPNTLTFDKLREYKEIGINRLSIGIQSLNDDILKKIGRIHSSDEALEAIDRAKAMGYENINADVMFNIPGQSVLDIEDTVSRIISRGVKHVSFYSLKLEKGTPMYGMKKSNKIIMPDEDIEREMYYVGRLVMEKNNLLQYEISNFADKGYECKHNMKYWSQDEYIGFGPSAHSFLNNIRYSNPSDLKLYCENTKLNHYDRIVQETLNKDDLIFEYIMLKMRLTKGLNIYEFNKKFLVDFKVMYQMQLNFLYKNKLIEFNGDYIKLTKKGMDISNYVIKEFM